MRVLRALWCLAVVLASAAAQAGEPSRLAVVVGSNAAAPGTKPLRYAHADADRIAEALSTVGGFEPSAITRLYDPAPEELLAALDRALNRLGGRPGSVLFFYYSGHADGLAVYPKARPLALADLRARLESVRAAVRIGMVDACRGGGWTASKGLSEVPVFDIGEALAATGAGTALIASSSGLADAHESEQLLGSFFTHHWVAAVRGSADFNQDGIISLSEAFEYARARTVRDTTLEAKHVQRPSYRVNLRGRSDFPIAMLASGSNHLHLHQDRGPLSVVHLASGTHVAETPPGARTVILALPPGEYVVRKLDGSQVRARRIEVLRRGQSVVYERQLPVVEAFSGRSKGREYDVSRPQLRSVLPAHRWELRTAMGGRSEAAYNVRSENIYRFEDVPTRSNRASRLLNLRSGTTFTEAPYFERGAAATWNTGREFQDSQFEPLFWLSLRYGITSRLQWDVGTLAFTYLGGESGGFEYIPSFGAVLRSLGSRDGGAFEAGFDWGGGVDFRWWFSPRSSVGFGTNLWTTSGWLSCIGVEGCPAISTGTYLTVHEHRSRTHLTYSYTFGDSWTLTPTLSLAFAMVRSYPSEVVAGYPVMLLGGGAARGMRRVPLVQYHAGDSVSVDFDVVASNIHQFDFLGLTAVEGSLGTTVSF